MNFKLRDILEKVNPYQPGYKVTYFDGGLKSKFFVDFEALYAYSDYYVTSISSYEEEGYGALLCFGLMSKEEMK